MQSTRAKLIEILSNNQEVYASGQRLSELLNISRNAVWKHMKELEKDGYVIEAKPRKGYRIIKSPNKISTNTIRWGLETEWLGKEIIHKTSVGSTQLVGHEAAQNGASHGTIIIADQQTAGRGRVQKNWDSNGDGLWMTIILRPNIPPNRASELTLLTAVAITDAIQQITNIEPLIKWPNDILINEKKLCGILTEMQAEQDQVQYILIGIGLNVNQSSQLWDKQLQNIATSLFQETGHTFEKHTLLQQILLQFERTYNNYLKHGFQHIKQQWEAYAFKIGSEIEITTFHEQWVGKFLGISDEGALLVESSEGSPIKLYSADIKWFSRSN